MSGILARIKIKHVKGANIAYLYQIESLERFGLLASDADFNVTFFNVGDIFHYEDVKYKVVNIHTKFFNDIHEPHNYGVDLYGIDDHEPFNFQITFVVENA